MAVRFVGAIAVLLGTSAMIHLAGASVAASATRVAKVANQAATAQADPGAIRKGGLRYRSSCAGCHGLDAHGISAPDLILSLANGLSGTRFLQVVRNGIPGTEMPAFDAEHTPDSEVMQVLAYLGTMNSSGPGSIPSGNAENGARLFDQQCATCHRVNGHGGELGPDLTRIGLARSTNGLAQKIRQPDHNIKAGYRPVTIVLRNGQRIRGTKKNEDTFSVQIMDVSGRLQGYLKSDVQEVINEPHSLMPAFDATALSEGGLADLVSYLSSLRGSAGGN